MSRDEVRQRAGITDPLEHLLHDLGRQTRLLAQLRGALAHLAMQRYEAWILLIERGKIGRLADRSLEVPARLRIVHGRTARFAVQNQPNTAQMTLDLTDPRDL